METQPARIERMKTYIVRIRERRKSVRRGGHLGSVLFNSVSGIASKKHCNVKMNKMKRVNEEGYLEFSPSSQRRAHLWRGCRNPQGPLPWTDDFRSTILPIRGPLEQV